MRFQALIAAALVAPAVAAADVFPEEDVKARCAAEWPGDFFMQKACLDQQRESWASFDATVQALPAEIGAGILQRCEIEWPGDYFMQKACALQQVESFTTFDASVSGLPADVGEGVLQRCRGEWPGDYFMQKACALQQAESWRSLNN